MINILTRQAFSYLESHRHSTAKGTLKFAVLIFLLLLTGSSQTQISTSWEQVGGDILGDSGSEAGRTIALSKEGLVVAFGAYKFLHTPTVGYRGHVRVYNYNSASDQWIKRGGDIVGTDVGANMGQGVALNGDGTIVACGAYNQGIGGEVQVFQWESGSWHQKGSNLTTTITDGHFGDVVALSYNGSILAVTERGGASNPFNVHIYQWSGTDWLSLGSPITGEDTTDSSNFVSLDASGTTVAIGSPQHNYVTGNARVFDWNGSAWLQIGSTIDGTRMLESCGFSLSLSGDGRTIAVGSTAYVHEEYSTGRVRVFEYADGDDEWTQKGAHLLGDAGIFDAVGQSTMLSTNGLTVAVGSRHNNGGGHNSGAAYVYGWSNSAWYQVGPDIDGEDVGKLQV
jgi:hypothetical protein